MNQICKQILKKQLSILWKRVDSNKYQHISIIIYILYLFPLFLGRKSGRTSWKVLTQDLIIRRGWRRFDGFDRLFVPVSAGLTETLSSMTTVKKSLLMLQYRKQFCKKSISWLSILSNIFLGTRHNSLKDMLF